MVMADKNSGKSILTGKKSTLSKKKLEEKKKEEAKKAAKREEKISSLSQDKVDRDRIYHQTIADDMKKYGRMATVLSFRSTERNQVKNLEEFERKKLLRKEAREKKKEKEKEKEKDNKK
tara:strand:+ start:476 stop:832 length:357 start_codon:yes stop_codon:yes gene_type:complete